MIVSEPLLDARVRPEPAAAPGDLRAAHRRRAGAGWWAARRSRRRLGARSPEPAALHCHGDTAMEKIAVFVNDAATRGTCSSRCSQGRPPTHWILVACPPTSPATSAAGSTQAARAQWRERWAERAVRRSSSPAAGAGRRPGRQAAWRSVRWSRCRRACRRDPGVRLLDAPRAALGSSATSRSAPASRPDRAGSARWPSPPGSARC